MLAQKNHFFIGSETSSTSAEVFNLEKKQISLFFI